MSTKEGSEAAGKAFRAFMEAIGDPDKRRRLAEHPKETIEGEAGIDFHDLDPKVQKLLNDLTYEELRLLSRVTSTLSEAGLFEQEQSADSLATICKF
jgi:hypothetical protein